MRTNYVLLLLCLKGVKNKGVLTNDSANIDRVIDNVPGISQSHIREIAPSEENLMTSSSQIDRSLLNRTNSGFLSPHAAPFNPISRSRVGNNIDQPSLDFNFRVPMFGPNQGAVLLNSPEMLVERRLTSSSQINRSLLNRTNSGFLSPHAAPFSPISRSRVGNNIDQPPLDFNFRVPMFGPNQGAVSLNSPEMLEERHLTSDSGSNTNVEVNTNLLGNDLATIIFGFSGNALVDTLPLEPVAPFGSAACLFSCMGCHHGFIFTKVEELLCKLALHKSK